MSKVTAETITRQQIESMWPYGELGGSPPTKLHLSAITALGLPDGVTPDEVATAREFCATAWNARHGGTP